MVLRYPEDKFIMYLLWLKLFNFTGAKINKYLQMKKVYSYLIIK
jgi:hypothetical protein